MTQRWTQAQMKDVAADERGWLGIGRCSRAALSSRWVQIEIGICLQKEGQTGKKILLPVLHRFKTHRMVPELEFLGISYAARWYS